MIDIPVVADKIDATHGVRKTTDNCGRSVFTARGWRLLGRDDAVASSAPKEHCHDWTRDTLGTEAEHSVIRCSRIYDSCTSPLPAVGRDGSCFVRHT